MYRFLEIVLDARASRALPACYRKLIDEED